MNKNLNSSQFNVRNLVSKVFVVTVVLSLNIFSSCSTTSNQAIEITNNPYSNSFEKRYDDAPFMCSDLPSSAMKKCKSVINNAKQQSSPYSKHLKLFDGANHCYFPDIPQQEEFEEAHDTLRTAFLFESFSFFFNLFDNLAMCHWSSNQFSAAKHYIDNFDLLNDIYPLLTSIPNRSHIASGRVLPMTPKSFSWHAVRQGVRFYENTMRTKHHYLCNESGMDCLNSAWQLTNRSMSKALFDQLIMIELVNSPNRNQVKKLWSKLLRLKAERALLLLADSENFIEGTEEWVSYIDKNIKSLESELYSVAPSLGRIKYYEDISLSETQGLLKNDELLLIYSQSMECRRHIVWGISRNNIKLTRIGGSKKVCGDAAYLKNKIRVIRDKIRYDKSLDSIKTDLINISSMLTSNITLPKTGGTIYIVLDEGMAGLPFELLPASSDKTFGELYDIKYLPSIPVFAYAHKKINEITSISYFGISRDSHAGQNLNVDSFTEGMASFVDGISLTEATVDAILAKRNDLENARLLQFITHTKDTKKGQGLAFDRVLRWEDVPVDIRLKADAVLLTACSTIGLEPKDLGEAYSSLSQGFLALGSKNVIASRWEVSLGDAKEFSSLFLSNYRDSADVNQAFFNSINKLRNKYPKNPNHWASWVLLGS